MEKDLKNIKDKVDNQNTFTLQEVMERIDIIAKQIKRLYGWELEEIEDIDLSNEGEINICFLTDRPIPSIPVHYKKSSDYVELDVGYPKDIDSETWLK